MPYSSTLPAGTPLWKPVPVKGATSASSNTEIQPWHPEATNASCKVFCGVICREGEPVTEPIPVVTEGKAYARVMGPVEPNDAIGRSIGHTYLELSDGDSAIIPVGRADDAIDSAEVKLIKVTLGSGASQSAQSAPVWL